MNPFWNKWLHQLLISLRRTRFRSSDYWEHRYTAGGNSGGGSYNHLAVFKANVLNKFVAENGVTSVIEFGCGDGNQLRLARYPRYVGYDVSQTAVRLCREAFSQDDSKQFHLASTYDGQTADLALSLDVLFHLVEDEVYYSYMETLFAASRKFVAIYSSNKEQKKSLALHVRHRRFTDWISENQPSWVLIKHVENPYPYDGNDARTSFCDFYFFERKKEGNDSSGTTRS